MVKVSPEVLEVLDRVEVEDNVLYIRGGQLDRKLYTEVNKILELMGGKWNRKQGGHVFEGDPSDALYMVRETEEIIDIKKSFQLFETPPSLAVHLVELAEIRLGMDVLEPSAGRGNIADELAKRGYNVSVIEILPDNQLILENKGHQIVGNDFLKYGRKAFDRIVMNPPFSQQQDIDHVYHAWDLLKPGGRLVAIMSAGTLHRDNRKAQYFRDLLNEYGWSEINPDDAFKVSGTMVRTITVVLNRPAEAEVPE
jgi:protein-L-isoaspartate O-methyltransferase